MSVCKLLASAAILSLASVPAMAQAVISEPGYCAFFYPNANCQNKGPGNPYTDPAYHGYGYYGAVRSGQIQGGQTVGIAPAKPRAHRAKTRAQ